MRRSACCFSLVRRYHAIAGNAEGQARQQAERHGRDQERAARNCRAARSGRHRRQRRRSASPVDDDRHIGVREEGRPVGRIAFLATSTTGWPVRSDARRVGAEFGQVDQRDLLAVGHQLRIAVAIEDLVAENLVRFLRATGRKPCWRRTVARRAAICSRSVTLAARYRAQLRASTWRSDRAGGRS